MKFSSAAAGNFDCIRNRTSRASTSGVGAPRPNRLRGQLDPRLPRVHRNPLRHRLLERIAKIISQHDFRGGNDLRREFLRMRRVRCRRKQKRRPARPLRQ